MCFERGAHWAGVLCPPAPLAGYMLDLEAGHSLGKVAGRLERLHDILFSGSDVHEEGCKGESTHVLHILPSAKFAIGGPAQGGIASCQGNPRRSLWDWGPRPFVIKPLV